LTKILKYNHSELESGCSISRRCSQQIVGSNPTLAKLLHNSLGHVVYTYVPLSPSSITWYRLRGGDALRLGR